MVKDYIDLDTKSPATFFSRRVADKTLEIAKKRVPFCEPCARLEFKDTLEQFERESERRHGFVNQEDFKFELDKFDLDRFIGEDKFTLIEDQEEVQDKFVDGDRTRVVMGHTLSYKCKKRGHGIAISIPQEEYLKRNKKKKEE